MVADTLLVQQLGGDGANLLPVWTALIGGLIGIASAWITAVNSTKAIRLQLRAGTLATTRIKLADQLRDELATLSSACLQAASNLAEAKKATQQAANLEAKPLEASAKKDLAKVKRDEAGVKMDEANLHILKAELLLGADSVDAKAMQDALNVLMELMNALIAEVTDDGIDKIEKQVHDVVEKGRTVVAKEWAAARDLT